MLTHDDVIVAIATPLGEGGLGVVRLSGREALRIAQSCFTGGKTTLLEAPSHTLTHGWIKNGAEVIDEAVAAIFRAPHSYTGEDVVEFSCHGSPAVLKEIVQLCIKNGARLARAGEFTQRAYLNGKMDLLQAEAVADLIHARSQGQRAAASAQLQGVLSSRIARIRKILVELLADLEANLDFVEEDIPGVSRARIEESLRTAQKELDRLIETSRQGRILREGLRVAIVGKPNVGKSSLFNALLAEERAIVTDVPGTTRDTLEETLQWEGWPVVLTDTAGLRSTRNTVEEKGTERARRALDLADVALVVIDGSRTLEKEDRAILKSVDAKKTVAALNKRDLAKKVDLQDLRERFHLDRVVETSAKNGTGLERIKDAIVAEAQGGGFEAEDIPVAVNLRHITHLEAASGKISAADAAAERSSEEALAMDVREALEELGAITGESASDDVRAAIFSRFCIGK